MIDTMEHARLGATGPQISRLGFGCWAIGGHGYGRVDDAESIRAIQEALASGINFFDTADVYGFGHSERVLAQGLGPRRHDAVIATKFGVWRDGSGRTYGDSSPRRVVEALEGSLRRLQIDCIPLYQMHWHDGVTAVEDTMEALCRCREAGKIRFIGCTNLGTGMVEAMSAVGPLASVQLQYSVADRAHEDALAVHHQRGIATIVYGTLVRGLLSGKYHEGSRFVDQADTRSADANFSGDRLECNLAIVKDLREAAAGYGRAPGQVALRWVLDSPFVSTAIVGMKTPDQVRSNAGAIGWRLSPDDWQRLSRRSVRQRQP